ncbi:rhomboid family intramembrane serine protease [Bosea sp. 2KB_26]|uniref:rhomboid family intramembrane serine protease n=1 Tax=Bosea sp. 2KB_26 TaxID=3237475 RepID=UPI003F8F4C52
MFPYGDNLIHGFRSPVVWALLALMIAVTAADELSGLHRTLVAELGFTPALFSTRPWRHVHTLVTASLLHGDMFHLAGNCLFLWVFGRSLERLFGWWRFALVFPFLGVMGFVVHWLLSPASRVPVIGASGAVSALLGAYLVLFPYARMRTIIVYLPFWKRIAVPAWAFLGYWAGLQVASLALGMGEDDGTAYAVHVGALALGMMIAAIWKTSYPAAEEELEAFVDTSFAAAPPPARTSRLC